MTRDHCPYCRDEWQRLADPLRPDDADASPWAHVGPERDSRGGWLVIATLVALVVLAVAFRVLR